MKNEINYYENWVGFEHVYLEDSFVTSIIENANSLKFNIELVLTKEHPEYSSPVNGEINCYRNGEILFDDIVEKKWISKNFPSQSVDSADDLGNIDIFYKNGFDYYLEGDWGIVLVRSDNLTINLL